MNGLKGAFDSFRVEEAYNWRDDIMEITRRIVHETDEARLNNIAEHFEVDLSEIREFLEMKRKKMQKPQTNADRIDHYELDMEKGTLSYHVIKTNADRIRSMTDEELAIFLARAAPLLINQFAAVKRAITTEDKAIRTWLGWLKQEAKE